jgi:hypothetical protein
MGFYPGMTYGPMAHASAAPWPLGTPQVSLPYPQQSAGSRRRFTAEEDALLRQLVGQFPADSWAEIASRFPGRTTRQVRERYEHYLKPSLNLSKWTSAEDVLLEQKFEIHGPDWAELKRFFPGRSGVNVKNRWTTLLSRKRKVEWGQRSANATTPAEGIAGTPLVDAQGNDEGGEQPRVPLRRDSSSNVALIREFDSFGAFGSDFLPFDDVFGGEFHW